MGNQAEKWTLGMNQNFKLGHSTWDYIRNNSRNKTVATLEKWYLLPSMEVTLSLWHGIYLLQETVCKSTTCIFKNGIQHGWE